MSDKFCEPKHVQSKAIQEVFVTETSLVHVTLDVQMLIRRTKYELIIKLITRMETNLRDEFIKPN